VGVQLAGVRVDDVLIQELLYIQQECFAPDARQRLTAQELLSRLQTLDPAGPVYSCHVQSDIVPRSFQQAM
jgi:hypothetical protein